MDEANTFGNTFEKALEYALVKHKGQYRKFSNIPYLWHPISVAKNVEQNKTSKNLELLLTAAILHDTVEDCEEVTIEEIAKIFGYKVAALVDELTSDKDQIEIMGKTEYLKQKMEKMSSYALVLKLSDRLDNIIDIAQRPKEFQEKYTKETIEIIKHLESCWRKLSETHKKLILKIKTSFFNQKLVKDVVTLEMM